jgi:hypothetical protein
VIYSSPFQLLVSDLSRAGVRVSDDCTEQINGARRVAVWTATRGSCEPGNEDDLVPQTIPGKGRRSEATVRKGFSLRAGVDKKWKKSSKKKSVHPVLLKRHELEIHLGVEAHGWTERLIGDAGKLL